MGARELTCTLIQIRSSTLAVRIHHDSVGFAQARPNESRAKSQSVRISYGTRFVSYGGYSFLTRLEPERDGTHTQHLLRKEVIQALEWMKCT